MTSRPPLFDYIQSVAKAHTFEKVAFFQNFYLGDKDLEEEAPDGTITRSDFEGGSSSSAVLGGNCLCRVILNYSQLAIPYNGIDPSTGALNSTDWGSMSWQGINSMNVLKFGTSAGANKYAQFQTNGKRVGGREITENTGAGGSGTATAAFLDYSLLCENGVDANTDCGCGKKVDIMYQFDANLRTDGAFTQCFLCGSRATHAAIEEAVAVTILNHRNPTASVVVAGSTAAAKSEANRTVNPDFWVKTIELAAEIGVLFVPGAQAITSAAVTAMSNTLQSLIQLPAQTGSGASSTFRANMLDSRYAFTLQPNQPVRVALSSLTKATLGGATAWQNIAESNTDFALAGVVTLKDFSDQNDPTCCSPKIGNWALGGFYGSVVNQSNLRQKVGVFFNSFAPWDNVTNDPSTNAITLTKDLDKIRQNLCKSGVIGPIYEEALKGQPTTGYSTWTVVQKDNAMLMRNDKNNAPFSFTVCDGLGRVITSGKGSSETTQATFELPNATASGVYLLRVEQGQKIYTSKFTKMN